MVFKENKSLSYPRPPLFFSRGNQNNILTILYIITYAELYKSKLNIYLYLYFKHSQ